jgi:uncharacterized protein YggE
MADKFKLYLMASGIFAMVALAISSLLYSYAHFHSRLIEPSALRSFSVSAQGRVVAIPDVANITFSVITQNGDLSKLQRENTERANRAIEFIKAKGVDSKDIQTASYTIVPRYEHKTRTIGPWTVIDQHQTTSKIIGYSITQTVSVKIRDFNIIGDILAGVVEHGANAVSGPFFTVDDPSELQNQARRQAIEKAKQRAKTMAEFAGFRLGPLLSIDDNFFYIPPPMPHAIGLEDAGRVELAPPQIEPGEQEITASVTLRYGIK